MGILASYLLYCTYFLIASSLKSQNKILTFPLMPSSPHLVPNLETLHSTPPVFHTRVKHCSPPATPTPLGIPSAIRQQTYYRCRHACTHITALPTLISLHYCPRRFSCCPALPFRPISTLSFPSPPHLPICNPSLSLRLLHPPIPPLQFYIPSYATYPLRVFSY